MPTAASLPCHADLNAIELIWAKVKGHVAKQNLTFKTTDMKQYIEDGIRSVTGEHWSNCCAHVLNIEKTYWKMDIAIEAEMERLIIHVDSGDDTATEVDDYSDTNTADELLLIVMICR